MMVPMNRTQQAWGKKKIAGALSMNAKSAFHNVRKTHPGRRMEDPDLEPDLVRWAQSFMTNRHVNLVLDSETGPAKLVDTGIPQGYPAAPIRFITYLSGIFDEVEREVSGIRGLSFADDTAWWAE